MNDKTTGMMLGLMISSIIVIMPCSLFVRFCVDENVMLQTAIIECADQETIQRINQWYKDKNGGSGKVFQLVEKKQ